MAELISRTGRVQSWIDDPDGRLPVSCTVFVVDDSMEGPEGIEASWRFASPTFFRGTCIIGVIQVDSATIDAGCSILVVIINAHVEKWGLF